MFLQGLSENIPPIFQGLLAPFWSRVSEFNSYSEFLILNFFISDFHEKLVY